MDEEDDFDRDCDCFRAGSMAERRVERRVEKRAGVSRRVTIFDFASLVDIFAALEAGVVVTGDDIMARLRWMEGRWW